ncbi:MAG: hypothetical protein QOJ44_1707 [Acidimicrobiaceae bacterium]|nr:hypothetical protein [Acidimicrobiaceae bacterium]
MEQGSNQQGSNQQGSTEQDSTPEVSEDREPTPGDLLRSLPVEAETRGTRYVSAQAMQARLFSIYDAAAAAEDALAMVQQQLTLTLDRSYYEADEIKSMAAQLDSLLTLDDMDLAAVDPAEVGLTEDDLVSE